MRKEREKIGKGRRKEKGMEKSYGKGKREKKKTGNEMKQKDCNSIVFLIFTLFSEKMLLTDAQWLVSVLVLIQRT